MKDENLLPLIQSALNKDQKAQTRLINLFWVDVFSFILKKVNNEKDADELTVSVFSKVLQKLDLYDPGFQFKTWVLTIAQNTVIDFWRRKARENEDVSSDLDTTVNSFAKSPEELLISEQEQQNIMKIVESMEAGYREIIRLRFFEEKSIREISEELKISVSNTKVRIMRAKKILSALLKENDL